MIKKEEFMMLLTELKDEIRKRLPDKNGGSYYGRTKEDGMAEGYNQGKRAVLSLLDDIIRETKNK